LRASKQAKRIKAKREAKRMIGHGRNRSVDRKCWKWIGNLTNLNRNYSA
jgi:hypothetical protein